jgi:16S rRNA (cytosine967-C5)-methyltransferase
MPSPYDSDHYQNPYLNHPDWLTSRWRKNYGSKAMKQICATNNQEPILCLRVTQRIDKESLMTLFKDHNIVSLPGTFAPDALLIPDIHGPITALPGFKENFFQVQGQAAQLTSLLLGPFCHGGNYLDCCAGLGGKTAHLASLINQTNGSLTAIEPDDDRFEKLRQNLQHRSETDIVTIHHETIEDFAKVFSKQYNAILVDAPCSGTGVICRQPDIRWNRIEQDLISYQLRQIKILHHAAPLLLPGGVLVYATCSIEPEENSCVISHFLEHNPNFSLENCSDYLPDSARNFVSDGCFAPLPTKEIDGFFAARLRRSV